jgi:hypothetical protein
MQVQKTDFDEFEENIDSELHKLDKTPAGMGNEWWTSKVKRFVGEVAAENNYDVYASRIDEDDVGKWLKGAEWLYDLTCLKYDKDGYLEDIPLVLESEWGDRRLVDADFQKLVVARADHRVMVMCVTSNENKEEEKLINKLLQHVEKCRNSTVRDRYMFACFDEKKRRFNCSVYKVVNG